MYFLVPVINGGELDIDYEFLERAVQKNDTKCYVKLRPGFVVRESWQEITEEEWLLVQPPESGLAEPTETIEQKLTRLEAQNIILMDALADLYEEILTLKEEDV